MSDDDRTYETPAGQLVVQKAGEETMFDSFKRFHEDNPHVYFLLLKLAREWMAAQPGKKCGIGFLFERARWELAVSTVGEPVQLNNNYRAFYSRTLMYHNPDIDGLFRTRAQRAAAA